MSTPTGYIRRSDLPPPDGKKPDAVIETRPGAGGEDATVSPQLPESLPHVCDAWSEQMEYQLKPVTASASRGLSGDVFGSVGTADLLGRFGGRVQVLRGKDYAPGAV